jgi:hypothetical protein
MNELCSECGSVINLVQDTEANSDQPNRCLSNAEIRIIIAEYKIPFICSKCGGINFPYKALGGIVFVWPKPIPETEGSIYIPDKIRQIFKKHTGVVLSSGKGCPDKKTKVFTPSELTTGDVITYDKNVPWHLDVLGTDDKLYTVDYMNIFDVLTLGEI